LTSGRHRLVQWLSRFIGHFAENVGLVTIYVERLSTYNVAAFSLDCDTVRLAGLTELRGCII